MSDLLATRFTLSNVSDRKSTKTDQSDTHSVVSDASSDNASPWDASFTQTECEAQTPFAELAWSVQQLCKQYWPTSYEEVRIARLDGGSFNRIVALALKPSVAFRQIPSQATPTSQSANSSPWFLREQENSPAGTYILRISRWEDSDIDHQIAILSYVRFHTDIPIPRILAYDLGSENILERQYTLQERIPGVPLSTVIKNLTFSQRLDLVNEVAIILKKTLEVESLVAGKIGFPKPTEHTSGSSSDNLGTPGIEAGKFPMEDNMALVTTAGSPLLKHTTPEPGEAKPVIADPGDLQVLHFDVISMFSDDEPYNGTVNRIRTTVEGTSVLSFFHLQFTRQILHTFHYQSSDIVRTNLLHRLMQVAIEMEEELDLGTDTFNLHHGDLEPRNIMVQISDLDTLHITGVIDWDLAAFVPRAVSCLAPRWLWSHGVHQIPTSVRMSQTLRIRKLKP